VALAARGLPVHLTTSDPAAHLSETLAGSLDGRTSAGSTRAPRPTGTAVRCSTPRVRTSTWRVEVLLGEDLRSPCTEEIAVFQAFARLIRKARREIVVMDTAPTGHTLLLLDATGAYHRDAVRHIIGEGLNVVTPLMRLQNPDQTKVIIVTLAEATPVLEAADLQDDLRRAGIQPWAWVINNSLAAARPRSALLRQRAAHELAQIALVRDRYAIRLALVGVQDREPVGIDHLLRLAGAAPTSAPATGRR
jgi:arsenite-transporting ATPase